MSRQKWLAAAIACALLVSVTRAQPEERPASSFIKVGKHHINADRILYTEDHGKVIQVIFAGGHNREMLVLKGEEADALRRWLEGTSTDVTSLVRKRGRILMEGVDLVDPPRIPDPRFAPQVPPES